MRTQLKVFFMGLFLLTGAAVFGQNQLFVKGVVLSKTGSYLQGVSIKVVDKATGQSNFTFSDSIGAFKAEIHYGHAYNLYFSYVGYLDDSLTNFTANKGERNMILMRLNQDETVLNDVVVVGYGSQKKSDVTVAIASVNSTAIERAALPDPTGAMQGQIPGADIEKHVGKPGSGYSVNIRGTHSIGASNEPLYVIDGIPSSSGLNDLNPADIEKIDVLKDASAAAIYGSRGAKGVVIVTTKHGKIGKTTLTFDSYVGLNVPVHLPVMMTAQQYVDYRVAMAQGKGSSTDLSDIFSKTLLDNYQNGINTDWPSYVLKNALQMNHNITASGGDKKTQFSVSAGYLSQDGNVRPEGYQKYNLRGNIDRQITDQWKVGVNMYFVQALTNLGSYEALRSSYRLPAIANPFDSTGQMQFRVFDNDPVTNPTFDQVNDLRQNRTTRAFGNLYIQFQPIKDLTLKSTISPSYVGTRNGTYFGALSKQGVGGSVPPTGSNNSSEFFSWVWDNQATYDKTFGDHHLTATVIQSMERDRTENSNLTVAGLPYKSLWYNLGSGGSVTSYGSGYTLYTLASVASRVNYSYKDKYLVTLTGRYDGSSHFSEGNKWGFFPSVSAAWKVSQEDFMKSLPAISDLKLRLSYGSTGNDRISAYSTQATLGLGYYDFGGVLANGYAPNQLANEALTWETTKEFNLGIDYGFLHNRIFGSVDLYTRTISNILQNRQLPPETGFGSIAANIGQMRNQGIEVAFSSINVQSGKFMWRTDVSFESNNNKLLEIYGGHKSDVGNHLFIGQPVNINYDYVFDGIWQQDQAAEAAKFNQKPGQIRVKDLDGNGLINADDKQILGQQTPKWTGSISNTFKYGPLELYFMVYTRQGQQFNNNFFATFMNYNQNYNQINQPYWTPDHPSNEWWQPGNPGPYTSAVQYRNTNFVRINNITLSYTFSNDALKRAKISGLRVYATAVNPVLFTNYTGFDPEWAAQNTYGDAVSTASYMLGVNLTF